VLDQSLVKGETTPYELTIELVEPMEDTEVDHYAARRLAELLVWVRFDRARVPSHVERYTIEDGDEHVEKIDLGAGSAAHALARAFGPGILGLRWGW